MGVGDEGLGFRGYQQHRSFYMRGQRSQPEGETYIECDYFDESYKVKLYIIANSLVIKQVMMRNGEGYSVHLRGGHIYCGYFDSF